MVTGPLTEMLARNSKLAETYTAPPPLLAMAAALKGSGKGVVVLSCSDPRLNPYSILGLDATLKATMVRNAGGRASDAIRTLVSLQSIGEPKTIVVMHHTDCGMSHFHDSKIRETLLKAAPSEKDRLADMKFGEILDVDESIREDLALLRNEPLILADTQLVGLKLDIMTGVLSVVE